jgi:SAM-dependent methyltransferase
MGQQKEHGGEETEREVETEIGALRGKEGGANQAAQSDHDRREQRLSQDGIISDPPSAFVVDWVRRAADSGCALDLAMGRGRHACLLARAGFRTFGVDLKLDAVREAMARARAEALLVRGWCSDLTQTTLPDQKFDLVVVTRYLQRDLFPAIRSTVKVGGSVLYETFTVAQRRLGSGPTSADHLLEPGELRQRFPGFEILFYEEVEAPEGVARVAARRR